MKKFTSSFLFAILIIVSNLLLAQQAKINYEFNPTIDSLSVFLKTLKEDTIKVNTLIILSKEFLNTGKYEYAIKYAQQAQKQAEKLNFKKGIANAYNNMGAVYSIQGNNENALGNFLNALKIWEEIGDKNVIAKNYFNIGNFYSNQGNYELALDNFLSCLKIMQEIGDRKGTAKAFQNIGSIYWNQGNYESALENFLKSLKIREDIGDRGGMAKSYQAIGDLYSIRGNHEKALENFLESLKIQEEIGDKKGMADAYNNIGIVYWNQKKYEKSLNYHLKCLQINEEIGNKNGIAISHGNLGNLYFSQGNYKKALYNQLIALKLDKEMNDNYGIAADYINIGSTYLKEKKWQESYYYLSQSLIIFNQMGNKDGVKEAYSALSDLYTIKGDYKQALEYHKLFSDLKDTLLNEQSNKQISEMNAKYDSEKKDKELIKKDSEMSKQQAETQRQTLQRNAFIIGFALVLVLAFFIFRGYREKKNANKLLEEKNVLIGKQKKIVENKNKIIEEKQKEIIDSITYAKRIQQAILPPDKLVKEFLPNSFILYKPKDIVAGDFYWIENVKGHIEDSVLNLQEESNGNLILIAAADCTGHGVPGAMVSVICNNSLNRSLREFGLKDPGKLLDKTRDLVIEQFEKSEKEVKDGMDISLCALNTTTNQLQWAGANNPLWIIRNGELTEIKPDKQPIGKYIETKPFSTHTHQLQKGDSLYLFSDGYADQFGGERGKKFKSSAMKELLLSIQHNTMEEQKELLNHTFETWKVGLEQVDDVLVLGIKI